MKQVWKHAGKSFRVTMVATMLLGLRAGTAQAQSDATAVRGLEISFFDGVSGVYTGLDGARNLSFTGGIGVGFHPLFGLLPAVELRGLYPIDGGSTDEQKNAVAGLRLEKRHGRLRLYGDVLFGRGQIDYENGGYLNAAGTYRYLSSTTNVFSPGVGASVDVTPHWSVFADAQFQRYDTPATAAGVLWSKPITVGVTYRLPFLHHGRPY